MKRDDPRLRAEMMQALSCDCDTGIFHWKAPRRHYGYAGAIAGGLDPEGYVLIGFTDSEGTERKFRAHRLVWWFKFGWLPKRPFEIDHINHDRADNRINNLRLVNPSRQRMNSGVYCNNTSGVTGVLWRSHRCKWQARINIGGKQIHLGYYDSLVDAIAARQAAELEYFGPHRFGAWQDGCDEAEGYEVTE